MNTPISRPWRRDLRTSAIRPGRYALLLAAAMAAGSAQAAVPASERQALLALFEATAGSQWTERAGWRGPAGSECQWTGVRCDDQQEPVIIFVCEAYHDQQEHVCQARRNSRPSCRPSPLS